MNKDTLQSEYIKLKESKNKNFLIFYSSFSDLAIFLSKIVKESNNQTVIISDTISKIAQLLKIIEKYIDKKSIEIIHKNLNKTQIFSAYKNISSNKSKLIIGTKTAIFAPFNNISNVIILDEESMYHKQYDQNPRYNVKDIAEYISSLDKNTKLIYTSKSPSIETYSKKPEILDIKDKRVNTDIIFIENTKELITDNIKQTIKEASQENKKVLFINNNKLHSSSIVCNDCGYIEKCEKCNITLKIDKDKEVCNICNFTKDIITSCPKCGSFNIKLLGIGNQKIYQELNKIYPNKSVSVIDKETKDINLNSDIIIGTDFLLQNYLYYINNIYSIVVFSADDYFNVPDFKSNEFLYRYIVNIIDIAKEKNIKTILIKTKHSDNEILNYSLNDNYLDFYNQEINTRKILNYPPFSIIIKLIIKEKIKKDFDKRLSNAREILKNEKKIEIIGENNIKDKNETHIVIRINKDEYNSLKETMKKISKYSLLDINPEFLIK